MTPQMPSRERLDGSPARTKQHARRALADRRPGTNGRVIALTDDDRKAGEVGINMQETSAARLAAQLRSAKEAQSLSGSDIADRVEGLTGERPSELKVSRWLVGRKPLLAVSEDLFVIAAALELDPMDLIEDAIRNPMPAREAARRGAGAEAERAASA